MALRDEMQKIATEFSRYGYRRIAADLRRRGYQVNRKKVLRLMRLDNLLCAKRLFKPATTDSNHGLRVYPNHSTFLCCQKKAAKAISRF